MGRRDRPDPPDVRGHDFDVRDCAVRVAEGSDVAFIMKRTLQEMRNWVFMHGVPDGLYHQYTHRALESMLLRCAVLVAYPAPKLVTMKGSSMVRSGDPSRILGFLICDPTDIGLVVHMTFVRRTYDPHGNCTENYRRRGIARKLIDSAFHQFKVPRDRIFWTVRTAQFRYEPAFKKKIENDPQFCHHPYLFFTLLEPGWETGVRTSHRYADEFAQFEKMSAY